MGVHLSQPRPAEPTDRRRSRSSASHESSVFVPRVSGTTIRSSCCLALVGHLCVNAIRAPQRRLYGHQIEDTIVGSGSNAPGGPLRQQSFTVPSNQSPRPAAAISAPEQQAPFGAMQRFLERACMALLRRLATETAW